MDLITINVFLIGIKKGKVMMQNELFEKSNLQRLKEGIAQIGLFWFSKDYTSIIRIEGEREISDADLLKPERIDPISVHAEYDMPRDIPRGRVNYNGNIFNIWVGEDCLLEDKILINMVKEYFSLEKIDSGKFKVKRHYHWNTKT
jgi:hypothetical protein